jgi:hypothetical protein
MAVLTIYITLFINFWIFPPEILEHFKREAYLIKMRNEKGGEEKSTDTSESAGMLLLPSQNPSLMRMMRKCLGTEETVEWLDTLN